VPFKDRGSIGLPFVKINWSRNGLRFRPTSLTLHLGRYSWNSRTKRHHFDHPGPGWWTSKRKGK